ncbi:hypothetical protein ARSQ2_02409 [Arsenophonus endosymbiont of Bemisia tabaci Q2]|nr:hypothetical protein ARSQ2_02409 [Arsenophonus endosymbiont of Bemisia tabaci Q2]
MISSDRAIDVNYQYENYNDLIDKVVNIFEGISGFDKNKIKKSVTDLAKAALSHAELKNTDTILHLPRESLISKVKMT